MDDQIKKEIREIVREAQIHIDKVFPGLRIVVLESERTEADIQSDVAKALEDRRAAGFSATNNPEFAASLTLDGATREERDLIEAALRDMSTVEGLEK